MRDNRAFGHGNIAIHAAKSRPRFNPDSVVDGLPQPLLATEIFFVGLHGNMSQQKLNLDCSQASDRKPRSAGSNRHSGCPDYCHFHAKNPRPYFFCAGAPSLATGTQTLSAAAISKPGVSVEILTRCKPALFFGTAPKTR
jgi:hypothetical protein